MPAGANATLTPQAKACIRLEQEKRGKQSPEPSKAKSVLGALAKAASEALASHKRRRPKRSVPAGNAVTYTNSGGDRITFVLGEQGGGKKAKRSHHRREAVARGRGSTSTSPAASPARRPWLFRAINGDGEAAGRGQGWAAVGKGGGGARRRRVESITIWSDGRLRNSFAGGLGTTSTVPRDQLGRVAKGLARLCARSATPLELAIGSVEAKAPPESGPSEAVERKKKAPGFGLSYAELRATLSHRPFAAAAIHSGEWTDKCWLCRHGKDRRRCRIRLGHTGPDWRDDPRAQPARKHKRSSKPTSGRSAYRAALHRPSEQRKSKRQKRTPQRFVEKVARGKKYVAAEETGVWLPGANVQALWTNGTTAFGTKYFAGTVWSVCVKTQTCCVVYDKGGTDESVPFRDIRAVAVTPLDTASIAPEEPRSPPFEHVLFNGMGASATRGESRSPVRVETKRAKPVKKRVDSFTAIRWSKAKVAILCRTIRHLGLPSWAQVDVGVGVGFFGAMTPAAPCLSPRQPDALRREDEGKRRCKYKCSILLRQVRG